MQRLPLHARVVIPAKGWPISLAGKEVTLPRVWLREAHLRLHHTSHLLSGLFMVTHHG